MHVNRKIVVGLLFVLIFGSAFFVGFASSSPPGSPVQDGRGEKANLQCCTQGVLGAPDSQCFRVATISECRDQGGAVQQCGNFQGQPNSPQYDIVNVTQYPGNFSGTDAETDSILANLTDAIRSAGIYNRVYNKTSYNCVNFSSDLEIALTGMGYNATVTFLSWGHAVTDVHIGNYTVFVEPQINASRNYSDDGSYTYLVPYVSLDYDNKKDSKIGVLWHPNPYPKYVNRTEGKVMISIYDSLAEAVRNGFKK